MSGPHEQVRGLSKDEGRRPRFEHDQTTGWCNSLALLAFDKCRFDGLRGRHQTRIETETANAVHPLCSALLWADMAGRDGQLA